ncbi:MAG: DnaJ domain-containing protein [Nitrospinaceae bacterium]
MKLTECYQVLNVSPRDPWGKIKKAYHHMALQYHPDHNGGNPLSVTYFRKINTAFKLLEVHYQTRRPHSKGKTIKTAKMRSTSGGKPGISRTPGHRAAGTPSKAFPKTQPVPYPGEPGPCSGLLGNFLFRFEKKLFQLDTQKNIHINGATASMGCFLRVRQGKEKFQVRIPPGPWSRLFLRVPDKGKTSFFCKKRGDLLMNIQVLSEDRVSKTDSTFFYDMNVDRLDVQNKRLLTLNSAHGPLKFVLPKNARDGQMFILKSKPDRGGSLSTQHMITIHLR